MSGPGPLRAAIIGAGWIAGSHAAALADRDDVILTAVCDLDEQRAAALAAPSGARVYGDWAQLLDTEELDALWVCTPPQAHAGPAVAALDRGLPVYLEKPVARSQADARLITAAAARSQAVCAVGYQWHALEVLEPLRAALAPYPIACLVGESIGGTQSRPWFLDQAAGGGNLLERGSHHIDLIRAVAGEIVAVQAASSPVRLAPRPAGATGDIDDVVTVLLHFASGALGTIVVAWTAETVPSSYWLEVIADGAAIRLDLESAGRISGSAGGQPVSVAGQVLPFQRSIGQFVAAVRAGDPALACCTPADAARTLAVVEAAEQSMVTGGRVPVADD
ncbi:MAG: Gfo/Idh/MocA family oxidoreductase [Actinomycetota bacterium]